MFFFLGIPPRCNLFKPKYVNISFGCLDCEIRLLIFRDWPLFRLALFVTEGVLLVCWAYKRGIGVRGGKGKGDQRGVELGGSSFKSEGRARVVGSHIFCHCSFLSGTRK